MKYLIWSSLILAFAGSSYAAPTVLPSTLPLPTPTPVEQWTVKIQTGTDGQEVWVSNNTTMTTPTQMGTLSSLPKGKQVFHWGPLADVNRWRHQGTIDQGELDSMIDGYGAEGGGFYFSQSITDTMSYGPRVVVDEFTRDIKTIIPNPTTYVPVDSKLGFALANVGISAIENYNGTDWMNIVDLNALTKLSAPTFQTFAQNTDLSSASLLELFQMDANVALDLNDPKLSSNPVIAQLRAGQFSMTYFQAVEHPGGTPFFDLVRNAALTQVKSTYQPLIDATWKANPFSYAYTDFTDNFNISSLSANLQIPMSQIAADSSLTNPIASTQTFFGPSMTSNSPQYLKNLQAGLETMDFDDFAAKLAASDPTPWTAYDKPGNPALAATWLGFQANPQYVFDDSDLPKYNQAFIGGAAPSSYRDAPLIAGGSVQYQGKGYYRITAHQKAALESNPLLVTDIVPDPSQPGSFLARHEYPSAETYEKFKALLSTTLASQLDAAQAAGTLKPGTAEFKSLTQSIITELMTSSENAPYPALKYQIQMAIQPFHEDTGITLRAKYRAINYAPLFVKDENAPFLMTPYEFNLEVQNGTSQYDRILESWLTIEQDNPQDPQYFGSPDFWTIAQNMQTVPANSQLVVTDGENYYKNPANLKSIEQRQFQFFDDDLSVCDKSLTTPTTIH